MKKVNRIPKTASHIFDSFDFEGKLHKVYSCNDKLYLKMDNVVYCLTESDLKDLSGRIADYVQNKRQESFEEGS